MKEEFEVITKGVKILICELEEGDVCDSKTIFTSNDNPLIPNTKTDVIDLIHLSCRGGERLTAVDLQTRNYYRVVTYGFNMNFFYKMVSKGRGYEKRSKNNE